VSCPVNFSARGDLPARDQSLEKGGAKWNQPGHAFNLLRNGLRKNGVNSLFLIQKSCTLRTSPRGNDEGHAFDFGLGCASCYSAEKHEEESL
jgi:hypothetical protein